MNDPAVANGPGARAAEGLRSAKPAADWPGQRKIAGRGKHSGAATGRQVSLPAIQPDMAIHPASG